MSHAVPHAIKRLFGLLHVNLDILDGACATGGCFAQDASVQDMLDRLKVIQSHYFTYSFVDMADLNPRLPLSFAVYHVEPPSGASIDVLGSVLAMEDVGNFSLRESHRLIFPPVLEIWSEAKQGLNLTDRLEEVKNQQQQQMQH